MQQITLPQAITSLIATDANGKPIVNFTSAIPLIKAVVRHLQDTRQNLSTAGFVDFLFTALGITTDDGGLASALFYTLTADYVDASDDYAVVYRVITDWLLEQCFDTATYSRYLCILNADYPMQSTLNPKKIAVWRNTSKIGNWDKRQAVSVRKWIGSTLQGLTDEQAEELAKTIDKAIAPPQELDVRHHNSFDLEAWERAYINDAIRSCMNPNHTDCEVGFKRTFITYCSGYHGLADNGLNLTVLYQDGEPVARAITFTDDEDNQKCFIRSYGDDRLARWLQAHGYEQADFKAGTILYTTDDLLKPYIDGDTHMADHHTTDKGINYWVLTRYGDYDLQTTNAYAYSPIECECCGDNYPDEDTYELLSAVDGRWYTVCADCAANNRYYVYTDGQYAELVFFHDGYSPTTNSGYVEYDGEYYEVESLHQYDLQMVGDEVYHYDDMYYCEVTDEYFVDSDDVITDAEQISTSQPVHFPYDCVSREYWYANVVECACGALALREDTRKLSKPSLGEVVTLDDYWSVLNRRDGAGVEVVGIIFKLADIERDYLYDPTDKMKAFMDYAIAYNKIQYLRFQELGI